MKARNKKSINEVIFPLSISLSVKRGIEDFSTKPGRYMALAPTRRYRKVPAGKPKSIIGPKAGEYEKQQRQYREILENV